MGRGGRGGARLKGVGVKGQVPSGGGRRRRGAAGGRGPIRSIHAGQEDLRVAGERLGTW